MPIVTNPVIEQQVYRWYFDDGSESAQTEAAAQNTAKTIIISGAGEGKLCLRLAIAETSGAAGGASTDDWRLQYSRNGGAWTDITTSSTHIQGYNSTLLTDAGATTQRLTGATGTFAAGKISEDGLADDVLLDLSKNIELLFTIQPVFSALANSDAITFRILRNAATIDTYTVTPTLNITIATMARIAQANFDVFADSPASSARVAQAYFDVFADSQAVSARIGQAYFDVFAAAPAPNVRMGDIVLEVMASVTNITRPTRMASAGLSAY